MLAALKRRYAASAPLETLPGYRQPVHPWRLRARNWLALAALIFGGLFYGLAAAIFPVWLYVFLVLPLFVLMALVVWALPETAVVPERAIETMFFAFLIALFFWPNYLALALPGVPWITVNRLITLPLTVTFVISLSMSSKMRGELYAVLAANKWTAIFLGIFVAAQTYTLPLGDLREGVNQYIDAQAQWTTAFFVGCWIFTKPGRPEKFMKLFMACAVYEVMVALIEWRMGHVPWRDIVPSFLLPPDESVGRILTGQRRAAVDVYRMQGTFSTALNLAEFLAFAFSAVFYWFLATRSTWARFGLFVYIPVAIFVIILTDSRIGAVGTAATLFLGVLVWAYRRLRQSHRGPLANLVLVTYPLCAAVFVALSITWPRLRNMTWGGGQHQASTDTRALQWSNFWPAMGDWPIGYGVGKGAEMAGTVNGLGVFTLDSYYILIFLNFGLIGGIGYFLFFMSGAIGALRTGAQRYGERENLLLASGVMLTVFLLSKLVLIQEDSHPAIYMVMGLACAVRALVLRDQAIQPGLPRSSRSPARIPDNV